MLATRARLIIATFWTGSLWTIGYVVAPTLFATLSDNMLAGSIAGKLFRIEAWISVASAAALVLLLRFAPHDSGQPDKAHKHAAWLAMGMLGCTLIGFFGLQPFMSALREAAGPGGMDSATRAQFGILHGVSSAFYLVQSLLAVGLVLKVR